MPEFIELEIELTEAERIAKECFLLQFREGAFEPCDTKIEEPELPTWYDEIKYKRGQQFFHDNRLGILNSNLIGLVCLLAEPRGLQILSGTGRSSTKETARKRYVSTILHTLSWYEIDLTPGSKSRKSLSMVRKMHFLASTSSESTNFGAIKQSELSMTAFGFMGFPLIRPHLLGIRDHNEEDREAFVHVWAVLCHMVGVKEKYNICLLPMNALEILCQMFLRYILNPIIQIETPLFRQMTEAMLNGMKTFLPHLDYDAEMFTAKMLCGVPGYQYDVDLNLEKFCRTILTQSELDECNSIIFQIIGKDHIPMTNDIPVVEVIKSDTATNSLNLNENDSLTQYLHEAMGLKPNEQLNLNFIPYDETTWATNLNDSKFHLMNTKSQGLVRSRSWGLKLYTYTIPRYLIECGISLALNRMRKAKEK